MKIKDLKADGLSLSFHVTVPSKDVEKKVTARLQQASGNVNLPGFRKGKVPLPVLEKRFGNGVRNEVLPTVIEEAVAKLLKDKKLDPAMQPKIDVVTNEVNKDLEFTVEVNQKPEIKTPDLSKLKIDLLKVKDDEEKINEALEQIAKSNGEKTELKSKRKTKKGDLIRMDFDGSIDGESKSGMKAENYELELGSGSFIPGFEEQLEGKDAGAEVDVTVTFPKNYHADDLAGKEALFKTKIHAILTRKAAKVDDELAKKTGFDTLEKLKDAIRERMGGEYQNMQRMNAKRRVLDALDSHANFDVPPRMVDLEFDNIWAMHEQAVKSGQADNEGKSEDELKDEYRTVAERRVRLGMLLAEIGKTQKIEVSQSEMNKALQQEFRRYPGREQQIVDYYQNTPGAIEALRAPIMEEKVVDYILEQAQTTEKAVTLEELLKAEEEADAPKAKSKAKTKKPSAKKKPQTKKPSVKKKAPAKSKKDSKAA